MAKELTKLVVAIDSDGNQFEEYFSGRHLENILYQAREYFFSRYRKITDCFIAD